MKRSNYKSLFCILALSGAAFSVASQSPAGQSAGKAPRLNRAPVSKEMIKFKMPRPVEATLENGLTVLILEDHRFPLVSTQLTLAGAGAIYEPADMAGLAGATAQMLREGTPTRTSRQIAEEVDNLGATINAAAPFGSTTSGFNASGLSDNFPQWFALATDVLLHPTFPAEELVKLKERAKTGLRQQRASPNFLANEQFYRAVFGKHPAAVRAATAQSVDALTPEVLARWHRERYAPQNSILAIGGDVNAAETIAMLKKALAEWKRTDLKESLPPNPEPALSKRAFVVHRPGSVQTDFIAGNIALDRRHPDYNTMVVMNQVVGGSAASRLFRNLREEKGYTYGVSSNFSATKFPGAWLAGGSMRTEVTSDALNELMVEIRRIREERVPEQELEEGKRAVAASFALSLEQTNTLLNYAVNIKIYGFPADYYDTFPSRIMAVSADQVQRFAQKYLSPDALQMVAVGDASKIKAVMEKYGPVEVFDADGKPMPTGPPGK